MNEQEFDRVRAIEVPTQSRPIIKPVEFTTNFAERTLLYGYDTDRNTWHVYMIHGVVHRRVYNARYPIPSERIITLPEPTCTQDWVPNKRLYPVASDYDFCRWLIEEEACSLTFTNFVSLGTNSRKLYEETGFWGELN